MGLGTETVTEGKGIVCVCVNSRQILSQSFGLSGNI